MFLIYHFYAISLIFALIFNTMSSNKTILIQNALLINEGKIFPADVLIKNGLIHKIAGTIDEAADITINAEGQYLMPGVIDDQVHFREPGLTHKAEIYTEALAAVAGGTTSYMEMPNTNPQTLTQDLPNIKLLRSVRLPITLSSWAFRTTIQKKFCARIRVMCVV